jgi:hypothetical protein
MRSVGILIPPIVISIIMFGHDNARSQRDRNSENKNDGEDEVELFHMPKLTIATDILLYFRRTDLHISQTLHTLHVPDQLLFHFAVSEYGSNDFL